MISQIELKEKVMEGEYNNKMNQIREENMK